MNLVDLQVFLSTSALNSLLWSDMQTSMQWIKKFQFSAHIIAICLHYV